MSLTPVSKNIMLKRLMSRFFVENFCLAMTKTLQVNHSVPFFGKFPLPNKLMDRKRESIKSFRRKNYFSHSAEKVHRGILL